jgi:hypothetical protein
MGEAPASRVQCLWHCTKRIGREDKAGASHATTLIFRLTVNFYVSVKIRSAEMLTVIGAMPLALHPTELGAWPVYGGWYS